MKIFERDGKINFVDHNNTFVGFDFSQDCCESFDWSLTREFPTSLIAGGEGIDHDGFIFDTGYFVDEVPGVYLDEGDAVVFRLEKDRASLFLTLWNAHNGYYAHGFEMNVGGEVIRQGYI